MDWYTIIKSYYPTLWDIDRVKNAVVKSKITPEEYKSITGIDYVTGA